MNQEPTLQENQTSLPDNQSSDGLTRSELNEFAEFLTKEQPAAEEFVDLAQLAANGEAGGRLEGDVIHPDATIPSSSSIPSPEMSCLVTKHDGRKEGEAFVGGGLSSPLDARKPTYDIKHERGEHRLACWMKAAGMKNVDIAERLGKTVAWVGNVLSQPRSKEMIVEELRKNGADEVHLLLKGAAAKAVQRLIDISEKAENLETKRKANNDILDRVYGKPNQPFSQTTTVSADQLPDSELVKIIETAKRNN